MFKTMVFFILLMAKEIVAQKSIPNNDLWLSTLLNTSNELGNNCDVLLLPQDRDHCANGTQERMGGDQHCYMDLGNIILRQKGNLCLIPQYVFQNSRAIIRTDILTDKIISWSKCPLIILPTSEEKRLNEALSITQKTRLPLSLAVVTSNSSFIDTFSNKTERVTVDVHLVFTNVTQYSHVYKAVRRNNGAWKLVRVTFV